MRLLLCISSACRRVLGASVRHCWEMGVMGYCWSKSWEPQPYWTQERATSCTVPHIGHGDRHQETSQSWWRAALRPQPPQ